MRPGSGRRLSIVTQFSIALGSLATLLLGICGVVVFEVHAIRLDLRRAIEERREAEHAQTLLLDLRGFERVVKLRALAPNVEDATVARDDQAAHLRGAGQALDDLAKTPHDDPSSAVHQLREAREYERLRGLLGAASAAIAKQVLGQEWVERARELRSLAEGLEHEVSHEARVASLDLDRHGGSLMRLVTILAVAGLCVLFGVCAWVVLGLVRPLRERGMRFEHDSTTFIILDAEPQRVNTVRIELGAVPSTEPAAAEPPATG